MPRKSPAPAGSQMLLAHFLNTTPPAPRRDTSRADGARSPPRSPSVAGRTAKRSNRAKELDPYDEKSKARARAMFSLQQEERENGVQEVAAVEVVSRKRKSKALGNSELLAECDAGDGYGAKVKAKKTAKDTGAQDEVAPLKAETDARRSSRKAVDTVDTDGGTEKKRQKRKEKKKKKKKREKKGKTEEEENDQPKGAGSGAAVDPRSVLPPSPGWSQSDEELDAQDLRRALFGAVSSDESDDVMEVESAGTVGSKRHAALSTDELAEQEGQKKKRRRLTPDERERREAEKRRRREQREAERERARKRKEDEARKKAEARRRKKKELERKKQEEARAKAEKQRQREEEKKKREEEKKKRDEERARLKAEREQERKAKEEHKRRQQEEREQARLDKERVKREEEERRQQEEERRKEKMMKQRERLSAFLLTTAKDTAATSSLAPGGTTIGIAGRWYRPLELPPGSSMPELPEIEADDGPVDRYLSGSAEDVRACFDAMRETGRAARKRRRPSPSPIACLPHLSRMKLCKFPNRRPYYGTFSQPSQEVNGRRPFAMDSSGIIDYVDESDDEVEDEPSDAESISDCSDNDDDEEEQDLEEFVVPTGYLSDEEGINTDAADILARKQAVEEKQQTLREITPIIIGPLFGVGREHRHYDVLSRYRVQSVPVLPEEVKEDRGEVTTEGLYFLVHILHRSQNTKKHVVAQLLERFPDITKVKAKRKIAEIAVKEKRDGEKKARFYVHEKLLEAWNLTNLNAAPKDADTVPAESPVESEGTPAPAANAMDVEQTQPETASACSSLEFFFKKKKVDECL